MVKQMSEKQFLVEIGLSEGREPSAEMIAMMKAHSIELSKKRTPEQRRWIDMTSIRFRMERYVNTDESKIKKEITIEDYVAEYLDVLGLTFKAFAQAIDSTDANLKKYLNGDRKFNEDLACRFGKFFHTSPLIWMRVQHKNDLVRLARVKVDQKYGKYDFRKVVK